MCYNCGCGLPKEDHSRGHAGVDPDGKAITDKTFEAAGKAFDMDEKSSKENSKKLLGEKL
ncbi:hypothetical protein A2303_04840 [Candidatus Falkowbacteria bacterium RIFOXYB2_FULL_47_14]|uniref:Uncharacterized protein n=1 Tax=Candidatus Falkowbacteria bacterium RIFOXYA2_FULL_47_19 TaxID=1797994 RepID=A0A1F5SH97_9BACT|nr:MAG: hypothetical protein A2227_02675 [Candidatus Falkowbacteria bacterium RIFOXYA2_FULL_47_19]OGF35828.1 MAG: hypothetical protein A2468_03860 [Candidatus Falkowbacteria bacterium RIFOXYC2_FULL_46_15]OGF42701.1 MAG: hypothetical protein A2303_04840 [Candidatus Falkowbacteria bacterium RIFOXYB2_FULL_47_14]